VQEGVASPKTSKGESQELQEPSPQPNLSSYYSFIEGGKVIPHKFSIPLFFELEKERGRTHRWMKIEKIKEGRGCGPHGREATRYGQRVE